MHTAKALADGALTASVEGRPSEVADLFGGFGAADRIGVVVSTPHGALGASLLYLSAVAAFYELQRRASEDFWIYPDFFLFHIGVRTGDHAMLDVWPDHKEVEVGRDPDHVLQAINDRAITWLAVPDDPSDRIPREPEGLASYRSRMRGAFAYSPSGRVDEADVVVAGNETTEAWVRDTFDPATSPEVESAREALVEAGRPTETYRRITVEDALRRMGGSVQNDGLTPLNAGGSG